MKYYCYLPERLILWLRGTPQVLTYPGKMYAFKMSCTYQSEIMQRFTRIHFDIETLSVIIKINTIFNLNSFHAEVLNFCSENNLKIVRNENSVLRKVNYYIEY